jgi:peptidoglycan/xylan/chitin deacetylase (PgdA/CDA1 family)
VSVGTLVNVCFHGVGTPDRDLEDGEAPYWITRDAYLSVLDVLADEPRVRISFDDGNASDVEIGLPALQERGLTATFYVLAGRLGERGSLSRSDVRRLVEAGMTVGSHGMDHRPWRGLDPADAHRELVEARDVIEDAAGATVDRAALPLGRYDRQVLSRLRREGYASVSTSDRRPARAGAWLQPRFSVRSHDTAVSVREEMLTPRPLPARARLTTIGLLKRLR